MKKSPRVEVLSPAKGGLIKAMEEEDVASFAGAVGFFDAGNAPVFEGKKRHDSIDSGAMGFFECLDGKTERVLGVTQTSFVHDSSTSGRVLEWTELVEVMGRSTTLQKVVIRNNKLTSPDMQVLSGLLMKFHQLQVVDFSGNSLGIRGLNTLLDCCRGHIDLVELHLVDIGLVDVNSDSDYDIVCGALDDFPSLRVLDLSANNLSFDLMRQLVQAVSEHPHLERLGLERNQLSAVNAGELLRLLPCNTRLQTMNLTNSRSRGGTGLRLLKRGFRKSSQTFMEALIENFSIRNLQVDGVASQDLAKMAMVLQQNEQLWQQRNSPRVGRLVLSNRGVGFMHAVIFTLSHLVELDLCNNSLESVPLPITQLKNLAFLSLEKNDISGIAMPMHLVEMKKLRQVNLLGNPLVTDLPKDAPADNCPALMACFRSYLAGTSGEVFEPQVSICFVGDESLGLAAEVERINKRSKLGLVRFARASIPSSLRSCFAGKFVKADKSGRSVTLRGSRLSFRSASSFEANASTVMLHGVMRECDVKQLPVFALFHRIVVFVVDAAASDWEAQARDAWSSFNRSKPPYVILIVSNSSVLGVSSAEAKRELSSVLMARFKMFGVQDILFLAGNSEQDMLHVHEAVSSALLTMLDTSMTISRQEMSFLASLMVPFASYETPQVPVSAFAGNKDKVLQWALVGGILSLPLSGGVMCSNLAWSLGCLESVLDYESSVFGWNAARGLFLSDALTDDGRRTALHLLETSGSIVNTGWLQDQWIVQRGHHHHVPLSADFVHMLSKPEPGVSLLSRLYRIKSPIIEVSVAALIRRLFLQIAGVLSNISTISEDGFSGSLLLEDVLYIVRLGVEQKFGLTVTLDVHSDPAGQVVHMITSAIERGLDEEKVLYERVYLNDVKKECKLEMEIADIVKAKGRDDVIKLMAEPKMRTLPDLGLLGTSRLFWNELTLEGVIGKGSFGEVSLATITKSKRKIALKKIRAPQETENVAEQSAASLREILRELWVLSVLRHPNIVAAAGVCLDPLAVCMEYLELSDLRQFLDGRAADDLPWFVRHSLLMDIASGMNYAHAQRPPLVHSDLKSPNILLCARNGTLVAKIADLGLASFSSLNTAGAVNNPLWSAPELIQRTMFAPSVDVYSFAIIAWEICSCSFPFAGLLEQLNGSIPDLRDAVVAGKRPDLMLISASDIPPECITLISDCWASDPMQRLNFREILGRLAEMVTVGGNGTSESGLLQSVNDVRQFVNTATASEPKTFCFLSGFCVVLSSDGILWLFDAINQTFVRKLRWKLAERVRSASCVVLSQDEAFFVFGSEHVFILSSTLAARRVVGDLTCCDLVCGLGTDGLLVAGRNESGVKVQLFRAGAWDGKAWSLGDSKFPVVAMSEVTATESWCVCSADQGSSSVIHAVLPSKTVRKSQMFEEKIFAVAKVLWSRDEVWLCAPDKVMRVARESMTVTSVISHSLRALRPVQLAGGGSVMFGVDRGFGCVYNVDGKEICRSFSTASSDDETGVYRLSEGSKVLQVPGMPHLFVGWSQFGLCSWRLDPYPPCPKAFLQPRNKAVRSGSKENSGPPSVSINGGSSGQKSSGGSSNGSNNRNFHKSSLHMTRKALARATVTCDETGKIISCNQGVKDVFGHDPALLVGTSVRTLFFIPRVKERGGSMLLYSRQTPQHFSASDLWKSIVADLVKVRIVNGQSKDGTLQPLLISTSQMTVAGQPLYVLLFEQLRKKCAILVVDESGVITSATENLSLVLGWHASRVQGKALSAVVTAPPARKFLTGFKFDPSETIDCSVKTAAHQTIGVQLQVIDFSRETYTIVVSLPGDKDEEVLSKDQLSHYTIGKVLGKGMCGEVREGTHKLTGAKVAIKHIRKKDFELAGVEFNGLELDLLKGMHHPNVVQLYDCLTLPGEIVIVMELITGGELFDYCMDKGPLPETEAIGFFVDIVSAVDYIHRKGVVHRDLKLENCVLEGDHVKIIDFGLGNWWKKGPLKTSCGSPNYAAPELFLSKPYLGPPVDVWAMGVILFGMLTGEFPFDEIQATLDADYEWAEEPNPLVKDLIAKTFVLQPESRISTADMKVHPLLSGRFPETSPDSEGLRSDLISKMDQEFGMPLEVVVKSLRDEEVNQMTATYWMLQRQAAEPSTNTKMENVDKSILQAQMQMELSLSSIVERGKNVSLPVSPRPVLGSAKLKNKK